ncbi:vacuolar fusion protein MON1 A-like protein [Leptotrombidium deliense]|uniref:Vacuolar fusion protein MON1 homolog n=1 Tax=Leptotrombidium deliense TaxID=299467 RepID=A0A443SGU5_9ACAR|nr:vacuolar fusion protein MON1 A-like protein [Leptotrombidium deliense]
METCEKKSEKKTLCNNESRFPFELFILSESGKPIYSWNRRDDVITLLPVCQVLINYFHDTQCDTLRFIITKNGTRITFATKPPLIFVVVTHHLSGIDPQLVINQMHSQVISIVTAPTVKKVFEQSPTYDLRRLLTGSEKLFDFLIENGLMLMSSRREVNAVECFLSSGVASIANHSRSNAVVANSTSSFFQPKHRSHIRAMIPVQILSTSIRDSITSICDITECDQNSLNTSNHPTTKLITLETEQD